MEINFIGLICDCCDFYKESDEDLECGAFKILKRLLQNGKVSPNDIILAKKEIDKK